MIYRGRKTVGLGLALFSLAAAASIAAVGCEAKKDEGSKASGARFGAPSLGAIVDSAAPGGLTSSSSLQSARMPAKSLAPQSIVTDCSTYTGGTNHHELDNFLSFMKCGVFQKNTTLAGPTYYRYWVDILDATLASIDARFAAAENPPACLKATAISKTFQFTLDHADATMSPETVSLPMKFSCYEDTDNYVMAFGKDDDYYYVANFTSQDSDATRVLVMARASKDGNTADLWFLGTSPQSGAAVPAWANGKTAVANRVIANKETGSFTYSIAEIPLGLAQQSNFIRSDGSIFYFKAQASDGQSAQDVADGADTEFCRDAVSLAATTDATACSTAGLNVIPTGFGLTTVPRSGGAAFFDELKADIETIATTDFGALGVTRIGQ